MTTDLDDLHALMDKQEPLHPDLKGWVTYRKALGFKFLNHPLVQQLHVDEERAALVNARYAWKLKMLDTYREAHDIFGYIMAHERPYRLDGFEDYLTFVADVPDRTFWKAVEMVWSDSDNIWQHHRRWRDIWQTHRGGSRHHVMTARERRALKALPDTLTVWRGISHPKQHTRSGLSWTLDRDKAIWFAQHRGGGTGKPRLVRGTVDKANAYALLKGRKESEIVAAKVRVEEIVPV